MPSVFWFVFSGAVEKKCRSIEKNHETHISSELIVPEHFRCDPNCFDERNTSNISRK